MLGEADGLVRRIGACARNDRNTARSRLYTEFHDRAVFIVRERGRLARGSADDQPVGSGGDLAFHQRHERLLVDFPVAERRDEGGHGALEQHGLEKS